MPGVNSLQIASGLIATESRARSDLPGRWLRAARRLEPIQAKTFALTDRRLDLTTSIIGAGEAQIGPGRNLRDDVPGVDRRWFVMTRSLRRRM